jgi:outer membrane scaffolding protein for murein synthesis (MipA/OmpV family)
MLKITTSFTNSALILLLVMISPKLYAEETRQADESKWALGVGVGGLSLPHYRGSDQHAVYVAPIPYIGYNGERLKIDREGGHFYFYNSNEVKVDVSFAFSLQVDSDDNRARVGMTNLDNVIEVGPRILFNLYESEDKNFRFRFAAPLRTAYATDFRDTENIGFIFSPYLQVRYFTSGWESAVSLGPMWANELYHDYFYEVAPKYVTATRAAYNAKAGYSGSRLTLTLSKRFGKFHFGLFARYDDLTGATFIDSPLIKQNDSFSVGAAIIWIFKKSNKFSQR